MTGDRLDWRMRGGFFAMLYLAVAPLLLLLLAHRLWLRRKGLAGLRDKLSGDLPRPAPGGVVVHGVSLGEVMLMRPLVPRLEARLGTRCLLTTTTETGRAALDQHFPGHQRAFLPLDLPWAVERFLAQVRPRLLVLLELEVWPVLLCACHRRGIPVVLINGRVGDASFRGYRRAGALLRPLFRRIALAMGQNGLWTARLAALGVPRARCLASGSLKADMVAVCAPEPAAALAASWGLRPGQPLLLLASTGPGEEPVALAAGIAAWHQRGWRVVICPRHPERGAEVARLVLALPGDGVRMQPRRTSQGEMLEGDQQVLVVDEIGKLAALYACTAATGGIALVGGSLGSGRGGQNMLEAAAAGCCTVVGWDTRNFPDAMGLLRAAGGVAEATPATLSGLLAELAGDAPRRAALAAAGRQAWADGRGAIERVVAALGRLDG